MQVKTTYGNVDHIVNDVKGIFNANLASSFTLGIAQLIGIFYSLAVLKGGITIAVKVNMFSQFPMAFSAVSLIVFIRLLCVTLPMLADGPKA